MLLFYVTISNICHDIVRTNNGGIIRHNKYNRHQVYFLAKVLFKIHPKPILY